jgi:acetyl-CoA carboxylase biotin carboxylase subunit
MATLTSPQVISFKKIAIANRGEVAVRIIRACQELGIANVLLHSEADTDGLAYRLADETICIGPAPSSESYLSIERNIEAAVKVGADAIHPGFGFLSENASFAQACLEQNIVFIGPHPTAIHRMGDKISARATMVAVGVPVVPGYQGGDQALAKLQMEADRIGYPLIIKAAAGGGGRGMKVVNARSEFTEQCASAKREALSAFGSDVVFLERYIKSAKHIEFQIFGDLHGQAVHLGERECSVQRRHQKIVEEAPSVALTPELRHRMGQVAVRAALEAKYSGAGTVEFLLDGNDFYFLEMNTRLQVEHTVTEMVMGIDLVKTQIRVAEGHPLPWTQDEISARGHAIECRLYAEDPYASGMPSVGKIGYLSFPQGPGRRFDTGVETNDTVTPFYDSMISKIIIWDVDRKSAIEKLMTVLNQSVIFGVKTNIPFLKAILRHREFANAKMTTQFINQYFPDGLSPIENKVPMDVADALRAQPSLRSESFVGGTTVGKNEPSPWSQSWRMT